jgi:hypothetical protein
MCDRGVRTGWRDCRESWEKYRSSVPERVDLPSRPVSDRALDTTLRNSAIKSGRIGGIHPTIRMTHISVLWSQLANFSKHRLGIAAHTHSR